MMGDMQEFFQWRAETLAGVHLTRRDDLVLKRMELPSGAVDLLVEVDCRGGTPGRAFGVRVRPLEHSVQHVEEIATHVGEIPVADVADAPVPYCAFVFTMAEQGFFRWIREPVTTRGSARLKTVRQPRWRELDREAMAEIVAAVNAWYDAQRQAQAA